MAATLLMLVFSSCVEFKSRSISRYIYNIYIPGIH